MKPLVLIIEDDAGLQRGWKMSLEDLGYEVLTALTRKEASELFETHKKEIKLIAIDACVPGDTPNTLALSMHIRKHFAGPLVGMSGLPKYRAKQIEAGCNYECPKDKLGQKILELLPIS